MAATAETRPEFNLHSVVMAAIEDEVGISSEEIADHVIRSLSDEQVREALAIALPGYVGDVIRRRRGRLLNAPSDNPEGSDAGRWAAVSEDRWEIEILRQRVCPRGVYKKFGECDVRDVLDLGSALKIQAEHADRMAKRHELLGRLMSARGYATVAKVPKQELKKIFNA